MQALCLGLIVFIQASSVSSTSDSSPNTGSRNSTHMEKLFQGYDFRNRPDSGGPPINVSMGMYVLEIEKVDEKNMDFTIVFFLRHTYYDHRLIHKPEHPGKKEPIILTSYSYNLWTPDTYVVNNKGPSIGSEHDMFYIYPDGEVFFSKRFHVRALCEMDLRKFPMDEQTCGIEIESFSYSDTSVVLSWESDDSEETIEIHESGKRMVRFHIDEFRLKTGSKLYKKGTMRYSNLVVEIVFKRKVLFFILQYYIPTLLIVMTSWVSFWVDNSSIPGRVGLSITTVLAMTTLMYGVQSSLPQVPYTKAIDIFVIASFIFVFSALIEFAAVSFHQKKLKEKDKVFKPRVPEGERKQNPGETLPASLVEEGNDSHHKDIMDSSKRSDPDPNIRRRTLKVKPIEYYLQRFNFKERIKADIVDRVSRIAFPLLFFIFNFVYWLVFALP